MMPNPLDVAFAALGNNAAAPLLDGRAARRIPTTSARCTTRAGSSTCTATISGAGASTRLAVARCAGLSTPGGDPTAAAGLPAVMKTEAWAPPDAERAAGVVGRAAARHAALRQAVVHRRSRPASSRTRTSIRIPEAWAASPGSRASARRSPRRCPLGHERRGRGVRLLRQCGDRRVDAAARWPKRSAPAEPLTAEQLAFINQAVDEVSMSAGAAPAQVPNGLVSAAVLIELDATEVGSDDRRRAQQSGGQGDPPRRDRRAAPHDRDGGRLQRPPRLRGRRLVVLREDDRGFQRLSDMEWSSQIMPTPPADVGWIAPIVVQLSRA